MSKKHVYFLINSLEWGGAEKVVSLVLEQFARDLSFQTTLITLKPTAQRLPSTIQHIALSRFSNTLLLHLTFPLLVWKLKKLLRTIPYTWWVSFLELSNLVHLFSRNDACISFRTNISVFTGFVWNFYKRAIRTFYPKARCIVLNSEENKKELMRYLNLPKEQLHVIYNPLNPLSQKKRTVDDIPPEFQHYYTRPWNTLFITIGRLIPSKRYHLILRSLGKLAWTWKKNFSYLILGEGPLQSSLHRIAEEEGIADNVVFCGYQNNVFPFLQHADCFLFTSYAEGYPNVLIDACAVGLPIITTNFISGAKECMEVPLDVSPTEAMHCPWGYLLPNESDESVVSQMTELLITLDVKTMKNTVSVDKYDSTAIVLQRKERLEIL